MKKKRILMTTDTVGGVWTYSVELVKALAPFGVEVALATMGRPLSSDQRDEVKHLSSVEVFESTFKLEWMRDPWKHVEEAGQWLLDIETGTQPDLIHLNNFTHGDLPWKAPVLVVGHSCVFSWSHAVRTCPPGREWDMYRWRVASGLRNADLVTAPSNWMLQQLRQHYGPFMTLGPISNGRSYSIPQGEERKEFVLSSGRLWDEAKNISALDAVARQLQWPLYVAGEVAGPDGDTTWFKALRLLGQLSAPSMAQWFARAPIFALPAKYEPFGLAPLEAGLAECALVLGDIPSLREIWDGAALFVQPNDHDELRCSINTLIASPEIRKELGKKARERALRFTSMNLGKRYWDVYHYLWSLHRSTEHFVTKLPVRHATPKITVPRYKHSSSEHPLKIALFYHSIISDWNNGNAHFLRGVVSELMDQGHQVTVFEPRGGWSLSNLTVNEGSTPLDRFKTRFPSLEPVMYDPESIDLDEALDGMDLVVVHEWNDPAFIRRIGRHRRRKTGYRILFHDTHHRAITDEKSLEAFDIYNFDGVLAFGESLRQVYLEKGWAERVWTWHEAADTRVFYPHPVKSSPSDIVWIGNWGDEERSAELQEFLIDPVKSLSLKGRVYGVRYPDSAQRALAAAGLEYGGWLPNFEVPMIFSQFRATVHVPRRPYAQALPGIPTIRVFEALACGIPLISAPWRDCEHLFTPGKDFLIALNGKEMRRHLHAVLHDKDLYSSLTEHGLKTILARHTCRHRVDELLSIAHAVGAGTAPSQVSALSTKPELVTAKG